MASPLKLACTGLALLAATAAQGANLYCCSDAASGRRVCSDTLPDQCRGRPYKILDGSGNVVKEVAAPLTPEQKAQAAAEAQRKKEEEAALKEQRRKDQALLDTYSSLEDIDRARTRTENDILEAMKQAEAKIASSRKQRKKFEDEAEFYKKRPLPPEISKGLRDADADIRTYTELLDTKKADLDTIRTKYDTEKQRYLELTGGRRPATVAGAR